MVSWDVVDGVSEEIAEMARSFGVIATLLLLLLIFGMDFAERERPEEAEARAQIESQIFAPFASEEAARASLLGTPTR